MYSLFGLLCCSETNTLCPCSTNKIGGSHCFPPPATPQDPMVKLLFQSFRFSCIKKYYHISIGHKPSCLNKPSTIKFTWETTSSLPILRFKIFYICRIILQCSLPTRIQQEAIYGSDVHIVYQLPKSTTKLQ